mgnify:CR=1 FL=1
MKRTDQSKIGFVNSVEMVCSGQRIFRQNEKRVDMGGYGSGGHNKIKGDITEYVRVDSFIYILHNMQTSSFDDTIPYIIYHPGSVRQVLFGKIKIPRMLYRGMS